MHPWLRCLLAATIACVASASMAGPPRLLRGTITHVTDGDSVWLRPASGGAPQPVRLRGIDAPEICQAHGQAARQALLSRVMAQRVVVRVRGRDKYERLLGELTTQDLPDVGAWMVATGHAWASGGRGRGVYAQAQDRARNDGIGLWSQGHAVEPRAFRRRFGSCHG